MRKEKIKKICKKGILFFANPRLLLCVGLAWGLTNGWAYVAAGLGTLFDIAWLQTVAGTYLAVLWIPFTPEKLITICIAIFLLKKLFPHDEKTLAVLLNMAEKAKAIYRKKKEKKKSNQKAKSESKAENHDRSAGS